MSHRSRDAKRARRKVRALKLSHQFLGEAFCDYIFFHRNNSAIITYPEWVKIFK